MEDNKKENGAVENKTAESETIKEKSNTYKVFSNGFGGVVLISLTAFSPNANAGSFVVGPCGSHST